MISAKDRDKYIKFLRECHTDIVSIWEYERAWRKLACYHKSKISRMLYDFWKATIYHDSIENRYCRENSRSPLMLSDYISHYSTPELYDIKNRYLKDAYQSLYYLEKVVDKELSRRTQKAKRKDNHV